MSVDEHFLRVSAQQADYSPLVGSDPAARLPTPLNGHALEPGDRVPTTSVIRISQTAAASGEGESLPATSSPATEWSLTGGSPPPSSADSRAIHDPRVEPQSEYPQDIAATSGTKTISSRVLTPFRSPDVDLSVSGAQSSRGQDAASDAHAFTLAALIASMHERKSGALVVHCVDAAEPARIHLSGGAIVNVELAVPSLSLGRQLHRTGKITDDQYTMALTALAASPSKVLGATLLARKLVTEEALERGLQQQMLRKIATLLSWKDAVYTHVTAHAAPPTVANGPKPLSALEVAFEYFQSTGTPSWAALLAQHSGDYPQITVTPFLIESRLQLTENAATLLSYLNGRHTLAEGYSEVSPELCALMYALDAAGVVEWNQERELVSTPIDASAWTRRF
jgi:hypothetical protein